MARAAWAPMADLLTLLANVHRDPKKQRALRPSDFNPYETRRKSGMPLTAANIGLLKTAFGIKDTHDAQ